MINEEIPRKNSQNIITYRYTVELTFREASVEHIRCVDSYMSRVVGKPAFCICENKDADQLRGNREADQHLCFRYSDSTIPLKSEISSL